MKTLCSPHAFSEYWNQFLARYIIFLISLGTIFSFSHGEKRLRRSRGGRWPRIQTLWRSGKCFSRNMSLCKHFQAPRQILKYISLPFRSSNWEYVRILCVWLGFSVNLTDLKPPRRQAFGCLWESWVSFPNCDCHHSMACRAQYQHRWVSASRPLMWCDQLTGSHSPPCFSIMMDRLCLHQTVSPEKPSLLVSDKQQED